MRPTRAHPDVSRRGSKRHEPCFRRPTGSLHVRAHPCARQSAQSTNREGIDMRASAVSLALCLAVFATHICASPPAGELPNIPAVSGGWKDKFWTHPDGTKFHYLEMGKGTPVILIHGSGGTAVNWMANGLGANLAKTNHVFAIDMRGHGQTVGPDGKR